MQNNTLFNSQNSNTTQKSTSATMCRIVTLCAAFLATALTGCGVAEEEPAAETISSASQMAADVTLRAESATIAGPSGDTAAVVPDHAVVICESASFYANYDSAARKPVGFIRTLRRGDKIGHTRGAHPVYNGWAAAFDFGPNDWGFLLNDCIGGYGSWLTSETTTSTKEESADFASRETAVGPYKKGTIGQRETVCAQDLYFRTAAGDGPFAGRLFKNQTFRVDGRSGDYVHGFAYGDINRLGWVQDGWFCAN